MGKLPKKPLAKSYRNGKTPKEPLPKSYRNGKTPKKPLPKSYRNGKTHNFRYHSGKYIFSEIFFAFLSTV
jgi:hypothetical protein